MGLLEIADKYEKMLQNPENRKSSSGMLKQQAPSLAEASGQAKPKDQPIREDADDRWMKELDKRMDARKQRLNEAGDYSNIGFQIKNLSKDLKEIKDMLKMVLDANLKLLQKVK